MVLEALCWSIFGLGLGERGAASVDGFLLPELLEIPVAYADRSTSQVWIDYIQPLQFVQMGILTGLETIYVAIFQAME